MCSCSQQGKDPESVPSRDDAKMPILIFAKMWDFSCFGEISRNFVSQKFSFLRISSERFQWLRNFGKNHPSFRFRKISRKYFLYLKNTQNISKLPSAFAPVSYAYFRQNFHGNKYFHENLPKSHVTKQKWSLCFTHCWQVFFFCNMYLRKRQHLLIFAIFFFLHFFVFEEAISRENNNFV